MFSLSDIGPHVTRERINEVFPEAFPGKTEFVDFFSSINGAYINKGAIFRRDRFFEVKWGDYDRMEIEGLYSVPTFDGQKIRGLRSMVQYRQKRASYHDSARVFAELHIPFAADAGDNDYWIEISSGNIKYVAWEENCYEFTDVPIVCPSFYEFISNFETR